MPITDISARPITSASHSRRVAHRGRRPSRIAAIAVSLLSTIGALTGCSTTGASFATLEREPTAADQLPAAVIEGAEEIDVDSARFVVEHEGADLWLARAEEPGVICLVVYASDEDWVAGCGAEAGQISVGTSSTGYAVVPDGAPAPEGATQLTDNVYLTSS